MSDKVEQETIEEKIEGLADQDLNEKQNVFEEKDSDDSVQEAVSEDNNDSEKEKSVNKKPIVDYLDPSILQVREISEDEIEAYASEDNISTDVSEKYLDTFSDIRQQEVVEGNVVGINDRDVLIDIGFKAEGVVSRSEFKELPEIGEKVDVFIRTFEDRRGNLLLSKEKADFQKRWQEIRDCFEE